MTDPLRERLTVLITTWREAAEFEIENSNHHEGQRLDQCADEVEAALRAVPVGEEPDNNAIVIRAVAERIRDEMQKADRYLRAESGIIRFLITPVDLNVLLRYAEAARAAAPEAK